MKPMFLLSAAAVALMVAAPAAAQSRYAERPPLVVSPDMSAPWVMQLQRAPEGAERRQMRRVRQGMNVGLAPEPRAMRRMVQPDRAVQTASVAAGAMRQVE